MAYIGPGAHDVTRKFGADVHHRMHFGKPYGWKPSNKNPPPGAYDANVSIIRPKKTKVAFTRSEREDRLGKASFLQSPTQFNPTAANYQNIREPFCKSTNKFTFFGKKTDKKISNPAPGTYNIQESANFIKPRVKTLAWRKPKLYRV